MHRSPLPGTRRAVLGACLVSLVSLAPSVSAQVPRNPQESRNLLENGSFENPPVADGSALSLGSAGAWSAAAGSLVLQNPAGASGAFAGEQRAELAALAVLRQTSATRPGQSFSLSFAYCPRPEAADVAFEVWFAGSLLETVLVPASSPAVWQPKSYLVLGASASDAVELRALDAAALGVLIDDCALTAYDPAVSAQRIRNGSFEDDPRIDADLSMSNPVFVGWYSPELKDVEIKDLGASGNGFSGKQVLDLDEAVGVAQRVFVVPDKTYTLRVAFSPNPLDDRDRHFTVAFGGKVVDTVTIPRAATIAWSTKSWTVTSESPLTTVELRDLDGGVNGALVDGISLTGPVPEPETDGQIAAYKIIANTPLVGLKLATDAMFARGITSIGDLDGDGVQDIAVGSVGDDDGAFNAGAVWIVFLKADKTAKGTAKISELKGGLVADLLDEDGFGRALTGLGDLDGDGVNDLAVGANERDAGSTNAGAVFVLFLNRNGTVKGQHEISALSGDKLDFKPRSFSEFGASLAGMGDVDGDGIPDLAIGARFSNSVQVCFLRRDGTVRAAKNITYGLNGFTDRSTSFLDLLGMGIASMGDFDGDGVNDLLVGAYGRSFAGQDFVGGQYLWLLNRDGTVRRWFYYGSENINPRSQSLGLHYDLGTACTGPGDIDGDGVRDILVGAQREGAVWGFDREEGSKNGAVYVLLLNSNGTIKCCQRLGDRAGGWDYRIDDGSRWGESLAALGDHDGNGLIDVAIGSRFVFHTGGVFLCELRGGLEVTPLVADFSGAPLTGVAPLAVSFSDLSTGPLNAWSWDFGDGATSTVQSPSHSYAAVGVYTVRLTVSAAGGATSTRTRTGFVSVTNGDALPPGVVRLGCGVNPAGSFRILAGSPRLGTKMTFGVDNPFGTQALGSLPMVISSWSADPKRPCGTLVAGLGMSAPGTSGERLLAAPTLSSKTGTSPWLGSGNPAPVVFQIPASTSLAGRTLFVQGRMLDASAGALIPIGLADGFVLTLQP